MVAIERSTAFVIGSYVTPMAIKYGYKASQTEFIKNILPVFITETMKYWATKYKEDISGYTKNFVVHAAYDSLWIGMLIAKPAFTEDPFGHFLFGAFFTLFISELRIDIQKNCRAKIQEDPQRHWILYYLSFVTYPIKLNMDKYDQADQWNEDYKKILNPNSVPEENIKSRLQGQIWIRCIIKDPIYTIYHAIRGVRHGQRMHHGEQGLLGPTPKIKGICKFFETVWE